MSSNVRALMKQPPLVGDKPGPVHLSSRIRLARDLYNKPFPNWLKPSEKKEVLQTCQSALNEIKDLKQVTFIEVPQLEELDRQMLVERHLISRELAETKNATGALITPDQRCSIMINEEDHLRIQLLSGDMDFESIWKRIDSIDTQIEAKLDIAFSSRLGYLTACPTNVGTGMRASSMLHLPGLVMASQIDKVVRAVSQLGIAVRGIYGEGSEAVGSIFQISNQQTLGASEAEILKRLSSVLNSIIEQELNAREKLVEAHSPKLFDKIGRAYGTLRNGHMVSSSEALNLLSLIRLAIDFGMLPERYWSLVDRISVELQPAHLQFYSKTEVNTGERDILRALRLRQEFKSLPELDFDIRSKKG